DFEVRLARYTFQKILDLLAHVSDLNDRVVSFTQLVANLQTQLQLLRVISSRGCQTRIGFDLETLRVRLPFNREFHLIRTRRQLWTQSLTSPKNHSRKTHRIRISRVPNKTI